MELWHALVIGLAGSLHCIGMCGPIAIALPPGSGSRVQFVIARLLYNIGRVITYAALGLICGFIGKTIFMAGSQRWVSIGLGVLILLAVFVPSKYMARLTGAGVHSRIIDQLKFVWGRMFSRDTTGSLFVIGLLNGFLPCGLVYVALAASVAAGGPLEGALYMAVFGLGTVPVMFAVTLFGRLIGERVRRRLKQVIPVGAVLLAALFILRGLSLGIPLISPKLKVDTQQQAVMECCHPAQPTPEAVDSASQVPTE